ncbi:homoserine kinase [Parvularcula bermudensis HTCC2503]|uniref:Homoserine kinase n=1 Tax=Parvularcula bermudensis (strain ATCC BAA-594 / HTCC2503 / KCTC 12087) TaxID=314260 RepID=E0TC92_PARBH|nr:homoserine kinase [Parvularcula bermudensis]ADM08525.1 homoserine kinase [Parvularcula bermudensis HTCC2503]
MAVFTHLTAEAVRDFLYAYDLSPFARHEGIAAGVENTNYHVFTEDDRYILTLFERRTPTADLPYFLAVMDHLSAHGISVPRPLHARDGRSLREVGGRPAALFTFLEGRDLKAPDAENARAAGTALAALHRAAAGFEQTRPNGMGPRAWQALYDKIRPGLDRYGESVPNEIGEATRRLSEAWSAPSSLPTGTIHADYFPDNVFFSRGKVSGIIDFYFACTDYLAYDLAIAALSWMPEDDDAPAHARAMIDGYSTVRPLTEEEHAALPLFFEAAALRFFLTRAHDDIFRTEGSVVTIKDPHVYLRRLRAARNATIGWEDESL